MQNATQPLDVTVQANQGTVGINAENGPRRAVLVGEPPEEVEGVTTIQTDTTASALVNVLPPDADEPLAVLQISGNSTVQVAQAVQTANLDFPTGKVTDEDNSMRIRLAGKFLSLDDIRNLVVGKSRFGSSIFLKDIAEIQDGARDREVEQRK